MLVERLCRRRTVEQVRAMMPPAETVDDALQRVKRAVCICIFPHVTCRLDYSPVV